jgi:hypothetical protein
MRKLITTIATAGVLSMAAMSVSTAAPVPGYETLYNATLAACTPPAGNAAACEAAINAYTAALIQAGVNPAIANASFVAMRAEIKSRNVGNAALLAQVEGLFELLLPDSGSIGGVVASPA